MNKKLILELENHNVYYVKTDVINYYITIPKYIENTDICIELKNKMGNYDIELNDEIWVMENIKNRRGKQCLKYIIQILKQINLRK